MIANGTVNVDGTQMIYMTPQYGGIIPGQTMQPAVIPYNQQVYGKTVANGQYVYGQPYGTQQPIVVQQMY